MNSVLKGGCLENHSVHKYINTLRLKSNKEIDSLGVGKERYAEVCARSEELEE